MKTMMTFLSAVATKKWHIFLALVIMISACAPIQTLTCPPIKIGVILNGTDTTANNEQSQGYEQAIKEINSGGIGQGCQVELIYSSGSKDPQTDNPQQDVQDLVTQGAVALIAPAANDAAQLVANMAVYFNIPVIVPADAGDEITPENNQWVYRITPTLSSYASAIFSMIAAAGSSQSGDVAILFERTDYGESAAVALANAALLNNLNVAVYQGFSPFLQDFNDLKTSLSAKNPAIVIMVSTQASQALAIYQMIKGIQTSQGTQSSIHYVIGNGSGFTSNGFLYNSSGSLKKELNGLILTLPWDGNGSQMANRNCSQVQPPDSPLGSGNPLSLQAVQSEASLNLVASAIQKVAQLKSWTVGKTTITDWQALLRSDNYLPTYRKSLAEVLPSIQGCQFGSILWPIEFNAAGQNQISPLLIKIEGGNFVTLYPQS